MKLRLLLPFVVIAFLAGHEQVSVKVVVNQPEAGVMPVEIIQPRAVSSAPNKLDELSYLLRNNSTKAVTAAAVIQTIIYEDGGKTESDSVYSTMDTAFHPDMRGKPFLPGTQMPMESPGPVSFSGNVVIKEVTLTLD